MHRDIKRFIASTSLALTSAIAAVADTGHMVVQVNKPGVKISPMFYGLMTEEINHSYDGGLYAELIQNRALNDNKTKAVHWSLAAANPSDGTLDLSDEHPAGTALTKSLKLTIQSAKPGETVGVANDGYWGIPVMPRTTYRASFFAKSDGLSGPISVAIVSADGSSTYAKAQVASISGEWRKYQVVLKTGKVAASTDNRFVISASAPGTLWITQASLFPPTYKKRANGNRSDLMQKLGDMNPSFLRLPGGNYLEGNAIPERFEWKDTIGSIDSRPGHQCPWGYWSSDGMGLLEYLEWCEDLKMQAVLAVYGGYSLNGKFIPAGPELEPYVQDALDEIEYTIGDTNTTWGARRAKDGHPKPFPLTYVEISNEDGGPSYSSRFGQFYKAIKAKYPKLQIIATSWGTEQTADVVDDHYYRSAAAMALDSHHYDNYDRKGPKIFVGEWASTEGNPTPTMQAALGDAAWLTGLERNSDLVVLEAYAPLLVNVNPGAAQWGTNLIGYDALSSYGSPSYYVQTMFGNNRGDVVLPVSVDVKSAPPAKDVAPSGKVGLGSWATQVEYRDAAVTHGGQTLYASNFSGGASEWSQRAGTWSVQDGALQQTSDDLNAQDIAGDTAWTDYTYHVKARKLGGKEGFLIMFHYKDDENWLWWNIGGWGNSRSAIERNIHGTKQELGAASSVTVETGRWYDIKITVDGHKVRCYLDDKLITEATDAPQPPPASVYATASREHKTGDVILKVVNISAEDQPIAIDLRGAGDVASEAKAIVLQGNPDDVNSIAQPTKVAPKTLEVHGVSDTFTHSFPAHSITVLRVKTR